MPHTFSHTGSMEDIHKYHLCMIFPGVSLGVVIIHLNWTLAQLK